MSKKNLRLVSGIITIFWQAILKSKNPKNLSLENSINENKKKIDKAYVKGCYIYLTLKTVKF